MFPIRDTQNSKTFPFVNLTFVAINIIIFIREILSPNLDAFINQYALIPNRVNFSNLDSLAPFVTAMFIHAGFLHILSNMWFLWIFGDNVEGAIGHVKYFFFYMFCGIFSLFVQYLFISHSALPLVGASGAIAGVLGAYLKFFPKNKVDTIVPVFGLPIIIPVPASLMLIYWFVIQAFSSLASIAVATASTGGVAYAAHTGGFIAGFVLARYFRW